MSRNCLFSLNFINTATNLIFRVLIEVFLVVGVRVTNLNFGSVSLNELRYQTGMLTEPSSATLSDLRELLSFKTHRRDPHKSRPQDQYHNFQPIQTEQYFMNESSSFFPWRHWGGNRDASPDGSSSSSDSSSSSSNSSLSRSFQNKNPGSIDISIMDGDVGRGRNVPENLLWLRKPSHYSSLLSSSSNSSSSRGLTRKCSRSKDVSIMDGGGGRGRKAQQDEKKDRVMENILANKADAMGKTAEAAKMLVESLSQMKVTASDAEAVEGGNLNGGKWRGRKRQNRKGQNENDGELIMAESLSKLKDAASSECGRIKTQELQRNENDRVADTIIELLPKMRKDGILNNRNWKGGKRRNEIDREVTMLLAKKVEDNRRVLVEISKKNDLKRSIKLLIQSRSKLENDIEGMKSELVNVTARRDKLIDEILSREEVLASLQQDAKKGKKHSAATRAKISKAKMDKKLTAEH